MTRLRYNLPNGITTSSKERYVEAWRTLAAPICKATSSRVRAFDPGVSFRTESGEVFELPTRVARALGRALEGAKK